MQKLLDEYSESNDLPRVPGALIFENSNDSVISRYNRISDCIHTGELILEILNARDEIDPLRVLKVKCPGQMPLWIVSTLLFVGSTTTIFDNNELHCWHNNYVLTFMTLLPIERNHIVQVYFCCNHHLV